MSDYLSFSPSNEVPYGVLTARKNIELIGTGYAPFTRVGCVLVEKILCTVHSEEEIFVVEISYGGFLFNFSTNPPNTQIIIRLPGLALRVKRYLVFHDQYTDYSSSNNHPTERP